MSDSEFLEQYKKSIVYKHNDLFRPGSDFRFNACVGNNGGPYNYEDYSRGYFESGNRLFKSIKEKNSRPDILIYPLVYVYRHAIELGLKHLIKVLPIIFEEKEEIRFTHNLKDNWEIVKNYLFKIRNEYNFYFDETDVSIKETSNHVDKVLIDLISIDPDGQSFRFPQSKKGDHTLQEISHINIIIFYKAMEESEKCFDYWFEMLKVICKDYLSYWDYLS